MSVKYNSVDRVGVHGMGSLIIRRLLEAAAGLTFASKTGDAIEFKTGDTIAGFMLFEAAAPVWAPARIRTFASQGR